jgi:hypothetical protein
MEATCFHGSGPYSKWWSNHIFTSHFRLYDPLLSNLTQLHFLDCNWLRFLKVRIRTMETLYSITEFFFYSSNHRILLQSIYKSLEGHSEEYYCMHHVFLRITSPLATAILFLFLLLQTDQNCSIGFNSEE